MKRQIIRIVVMGALLAVIFWVQSRLQDSATTKEPDVYTESRQLMGTSFVITMAETKPSEELKRIADKAFQRAKEIDTKFSTYSPSSMISQINQNAGKEPVSVDDEMIAMLEFANKMSEDSEGAFDVTFQSFGKIWTFKTDTFKLPDPELIKERLKFINFRDVIIDKTNKTVLLKNSENQIEFGAFIPGYAADEMATVLKAEGVTHFMADAGGELSVSGTKFGKRWKLGVAHPRRPRGSLLGSIELSTPISIVSSGDYEKYVEVDGVRYHHIIDPRTGYPSRGVQAVTVLADKAMVADALCTAVMVLGTEKGLALVARYPNTKVLIVEDSGNIKGDITLSPL